MALKDELLKPIWHAFTALDVDQSGKVSKSQLKVLSHNLCTLLNVPHDPVALDEHFRDDDEGPVSNQGYMPYLNKFILDKVHGEINKVEFNRMCWTLCAKKNLTKSLLCITEESAFKIWAIFNFLSEDKYPLIIVPEEIEYLLKKLTEAMGGGWQQALFEDYRIGLHRKQNGLSAWELIELIGSGEFSKGMDHTTVSMAINEVFNELVLDILKQGYMWKKGHKRKNWTERWFVLEPNMITYYIGEDLKDKKGEIILDGNCCVESLPDKDGKKCLFLVKCVEKSYEISASDKKKKQEWIQVIRTVVEQRQQGLPPLHKEARRKRRALRQKALAEQREIEKMMKDLQTANEAKQQELETVRKQLQEAAERASVEAKRLQDTHLQLQKRFMLDLEREQMIRIQMENKVAEKSSELEQNLLRLRELEDLYVQLQEALNQEKRARQEEENARYIQERLLEEEATKRARLEKLHREQEITLKTTEAEKKELESMRQTKERELQEAMEQLQQLERDRVKAREDYQIVRQKLDEAACNTKSWQKKVAKQEGLIRLIQPGSKIQEFITHWGPASVTDAEFKQLEKQWQEQKSASSK
ncbi:switch-associated 70 [Pelobates cultripes]|uniref:Switch-associated protein 70 n=1 Tax=Pelobates cultripes TaxID=61616 RepID=A0AAD1WRM2_PELCU|nr:switch-associated 70 [Pelobates cultripes]